VPCAGKVVVVQIMPKLSNTITLVELFHSLRFSSRESLGKLGNFGVWPALSLVDSGLVGVLVRIRERKFDSM